MNTNLPLVTVVAPQDELQVAALVLKVEPIYKTPYYAEQLSADAAFSHKISAGPTIPYRPKTAVRKKGKPTLRTSGRLPFYKMMALGSCGSSPIGFGVPRAVC